MYPYFTGTGQNCLSARWLGAADACGYPGHATLLTFDALAAVPSLTTLTRA